MAIGKLKTIENLDAKFGADPTYVFLKVQALHGAEEYWLVTTGEAVRFAKRGIDNSEDIAQLPFRRGVFAIIENTEAKFGAAADYYGIRVVDTDKPIAWLLTDSDLEVIRTRVEANKEDIQANKESWLADLLD